MGGVQKKAPARPNICLGFSKELINCEKRPR